MQSIQTRLDMLQSKILKLTKKMEERERDCQTLKNENNRLQTLLKTQENEVKQWKSKVNSVVDDQQKDDHRLMIKAEIEEYKKEIDDCIALINAM